MTKYFNFLAAIVVVLAGGLNGCKKTLNMKKKLRLLGSMYLITAMLFVHVAYAQKLKITLLLLGILAFALSPLYAQQVVIKDSVVTSSNDTAYNTESPYYYTYDANCRLVKRTDLTSRAFLYDYYPLTDYWNNFDSGWRPTYLTTNTYNSQAKITQSVIQTYDTTGSKFVNTTKTVYTYDANGYQVKQDDYQAVNPPSPVWTLIQEETFYRNNQGILDSTVVTFQGKVIERSSYTYGSSGKSASILTYAYNNGELQFVQKVYTSSDSANYIKKDTSVTSIANSINPGVFRIPAFSYITHIYNTDGTQKELDEHIKISSFVVFEIYGKTYSTYGSCQSVLPVTLLGFTGRMQNGNAVLQWKTVHEINASYYAIQRSTDGEHFITAGNVKATGNTGGSGNYRYTDAGANSVSSTKLYYKLAQVDADGKITYSAIVLLTVSDGAILVSVQPNPFTSEVTIYSRETMTKANISVTDMRGSVVYKSQRSLQAGSHISINASGFAKGMYVVMVQSAISTQRYKVIKQ